MSKVLEGLKTRLHMMRSAWMSDLVVQTPEPPTEFAPVTKALKRGKSGAILIIVALLVFHFLYFASPILIPIVMALLLSMLLAPLVGLMGRLRVPRTLGSLIVVVTAVGSLFGIAASLSGPAQSWLTEPQRFSRLEEKLRPIAAPLEKLQYAIAQVGKAMAPTVGPAIQEVDIRQPQLAGLLSTGFGKAAFTIGAIITLLYMFLVSGDTFLRKLVLVTPLLQDKKRAVDIVRNIQIDISFYLSMVAAINIFIGLVVTATTAAVGIHDPFLWGAMATVLSFAPYVGEVAIVILLTLAGILTFDSLAPVLVAPIIYFIAMTMCWQGFIPFVVGRRMMLSPVAILITIITLGWMWGVIGALVAVPVLASVKIICKRFGSLDPVVEFFSP